MPKTKAKKTTDFKTVMTKSVFLYGKPNKEKADALRAAQETYLREINRFIELVDESSECLMAVVTDGSKSPEARAFEKGNRAKDISATFSQAAFDDAFTKLETRMDNIRKDILSVEDGCLVMSKILFGMVLAKKTKTEMLNKIKEVDASYKIKQPRFAEWTKELNEMDDAVFEATCSLIRELAEEGRMAYRRPVVKRADVRLVSTNFRFSLTDDIKAGAVIEISLPAVKGYTAVPLEMSRNGKRRLEQYGACNSATYDMMEDGRIRVSVAFKKKLKKPDTTKTEGVDVGISDALHTKTEGAISTLRDVIEFYKKNVEPKFAEKTKLINKKRKLKNYLKRHPNVPADVKKQIRKKIDHLEIQIRQVKNAYRQSRRYHAMLKKRVKDVVDEYIKILKGDKTVLTALELLDIKEFNKSKKVNGMYSMFARGLLAETLMQQLNWHGYDFIQVDPAYTSQSCPVCHWTDAGNRNDKKFKCLCCGHEDDADHVGSINIAARADDEEISKACETNKYNKNERHKAIKTILNTRNSKWVGVRIMATKDVV